MKLKRIKIEKNDKSISAILNKKVDTRYTCKTLYDAYERPSLDKVASYEQIIEMLKYFNNGNDNSYISSYNSYQYSICYTININDSIKVYNADTNTELLDIAYIEIKETAKNIYVTKIVFNY